MPMTVDQLADGLPPGRLVTPDSRFARTDPAPNGPVLWVTDEPLEEADAGHRWARLFARRRETGLWPLLLGSPAQGDPWHTGALAPVPADWADAVDVEALLARGWEEFTEDWESREWEDGRSRPRPFDVWPGPAPDGAAGPGPDPAPDPDPDQQAVDLATSRAGVDALLAGSGRDTFLGLVAAADGAEAITSCGWSSGAGCERAAAVLRTWQRRFGVTLCCLGTDTLGVAVARSPRTAEHARHVAAEHFAFCNDLAQDHDFEEYAARLIRARVWTLWWD